MDSIIWLAVKPSSGTSFQSFFTAFFEVWYVGSHNMGAAQAPHTSPAQFLGIRGRGVFDPGRVELRAVF